MTATSAQGWVVLKISGEVDLARLQELEDLVAANSAQFSNMVFDLTDVTFMDSTGLGWLIRSRDLLLGQGRLCSVVVPDALDRLFGAAGLTDYFETYRSTEAAVRGRETP